MLDPRDDSDTGIPAEDLNALADRLRGWQPSVGRLDRDRLIFEAGRAAGLAEARGAFRRRSWPMAIATAASLMLAVGLFLTRHPERSGAGMPERVETAEIPRQPKPIAEIPPAVPSDPNSYLTLSRRIAGGGLDPIRIDSTQPDGSVPASPADGPSPLRARDLDRLLNL